MSTQEELMHKKNQIVRSIERAITNSKKLGQARMTLATTKNRISALKEAYTEAKDLNARITASVDEKTRATHPYFVEGHFDHCEETYLETLDFMSEMLSKVTPSADQTDVTVSQVQSNPVKTTSHLPRIHLPSFDGTFEAWESFRDRFKSMVINDRSLSNVDRLHFLCSALKGDASNAISHLSITDKNFDVAWKLVTSRFENKRRLIMTHLNTLFSLPHATTESPRELRDLRDRLSVALEALRNLDRPVDQWSDISVFLGVQKLDRSTRKAWELQQEDVNEFPTYTEFDMFLEMRIRALEAMAPLTVSKLTDHAKVKSSKPKAIATHSTTVSNLTCPVCKQNHLLYQCSLFLERDPSDRFDFIKKQRRCVNCFSSKHTAVQCKSQHRCKECNQQHHTLLHFPRKSEQARSEQQKPTTSFEQAGDAEISANLVSNSPIKYGVLLSTARVQVHSANGQSIIARALLDQGSVATLITERLAQSLRLRRIKQPIRITGIAETQSVAQHAAVIRITPASCDRPVYSTTAVIMRSLTRYVPPQSKMGSNWTHISDVELADNNPMSSDPIDLIIGADVYSQVILTGPRKGLPDTPIAQNTTLGWILSGPPSPTTTPSSINVHNITVFETLDNTLRQFWESEDISRQVSTTPEEELCESHFQKTHSRQSDGRYVVRLPFKRTPPLDIGDSRSAALRSLQRVERRLQSNPTHATMYRDFLLEYEALGHMKPAPIEPPTIPSQRYYIPHHAVFRDSSSTTRLRVVFNGSSRTTNGRSLNDHLFNGPKLQGDLNAILLRWRLHRFVYTAAIEKMYRQIRVHHQDTDYQRILWRRSPSLPVQEYNLLTVTYGTTSAPFQALRVLKQLIEGEGSKHPLASPVLQTQVYVDDCLFGSDSIDLLRQTRDQLIALLAAGGFRLRKWASNHSSLLEDIDPSDNGLASSKILQHEETVPVLGVVWSPAHDEFRFRLSIPAESSTTKRKILSTLARLFDPLGWVTPVVIVAKIIMQRLWASRCEWDEQVPDELKREWQRYLADLPDMSLMKIPRKLSQDPAQARSIHGFADASSKAYAAVVYLRSTLPDGTVCVALLAAKSRVAPLKTISIPRLELSAALLLSRLVSFIRTSLGLNECHCHCWTDSSITLAWLSQTPSKWKTYVANRVSKIQTLLPDTQWHHVPTRDNPADCASRGMSPRQLKDHHIWWSGPQWLTDHSDHWPKGYLPPTAQATSEERTPRAPTLVVIQDLSDLSTRYSSWSRLVRVTAYVMRFVTCLRVRSKGGKSHSPATPKSISLSPNECETAKILWLKRIQRDSFPLELQLLLASRPVPASSLLSSMVPYVDSNGLIRARGRLAKSALPESAKHPIILRSHPILTLIIEYTHRSNLHSGPQLTLACFRNEYWILRARATVRGVLHQCVTCARERATLPSELMGDLPESRVNQVTRAFIHTGVDYAGPIQIRTAPGRGHKSHKAYIALFVCMTTKAIHLELVSDYSSAAFVASYHRFVSRRGVPTAMYSDDGTTFKGANRELTDAYLATINDVTFKNSRASEGTAWHFLPPAAPHFGGLWEAAVKSVKYHLKRCIGAHTLTFEEMSTLLCKIEACLNSRPIAQTSDNIDDYSALTPGHFLIGSPLLATPEPSVLNINEIRLSRWQLLQRLTETFWKAWTNDYLHTLHQRPKWRVVQGLAKVGQIVLIRNPNTPPCSWELGRIIQCHHGDDGFVRVVTVRTAHSTYKRPITKLCFLPVSINEEGESSSSKPSPQST